MVAIISVAVSCAGHSTKREPPSAATPQRTLFPAELAWSRDVEEAPTATPTADRTHVFVPLEKRVLAFDRETGDTAWAADVATRWPLIPVGRTIYALSNDRLVQLDAATGAVVEQAELPGTPTGPAAQGEDVLIIPIAPASLVAWHIRESRVIWNQTVPAATQLKPVLVGDTVFAALTDDHVTALALADGANQWTTKLTGTPRVLAASRTVVLVGSSDRLLYALRPATGALNWTIRAVSDIIGANADEARVYVTTLDNTVRAFDATHGGRRWKTVVDTRPTVPPQMTMDGLIVAGADSRLLLLATATGRKAGTHALPDTTIVRDPPVVLEGREADHVAMVVMLGGPLGGQIVGIRPKPPEPEKPAAGDKAASAPATPAAQTAAPPTP
jgi:outer membrane protein assembly factor BamB